MVEIVAKSLKPLKRPGKKQPGERPKGWFSQPFRLRWRRETRS
jgi:hypothetical protein